MRWISWSIMIGGVLLALWALWAGISQDIDGTEAMIYAVGGLVVVVIGEVLGRRWR